MSVEDMTPPAVSAQDAVRWSVATLPRGSGHRRRGARVDGPRVVSR